jgi:uncharacterized Zn finger protein (UPF0148 family)
MTKETVLKNRSNWIVYADGNVSCPVCGSLVAIYTKELHIEWHLKDEQK